MEIKLADLENISACRCLGKSAVLTGSHAYGTPTEDSDIDVAVLMSRQDLDALLLTVELPTLKTAGYGSRSLRFGKLNLIIETDPELYQTWVDGTAFLKTKAPVERSYAVAVLQGMVDVIEERREKEAAEA